MHQPIGGGSPLQIIAIVKLAHVKLIGHLASSVNSLKDVHTPNEISSHKRICPLADDYRTVFYCTECEQTIEKNISSGMSGSEKPTS